MVKNEDDNKTKYNINPFYEWWSKKTEIPEDIYESCEKIYNRIGLLNNQCLLATKSQLKEEFGHLDVEKILTTLVDIELITEDK